MDQRLNLGNEVRELKLGSTFNTPKPRTSFHTLKYDFKPASVDLSKTATLDVSSNNQVTVTMPHLDSSGVPKTVFKGNQRNYTKECVLIIDKRTGEITLEKLHHNIQVKKTRSETNNKSSANFPSQSQSQSQSHQSSMNNASGSGIGGGNVGGAMGGAMSGPGIVGNIGNTTTSASSSGVTTTNAGRPFMENNTQRKSNKTRVSTGIRKNAIGQFVQRHSPIQGSPSYPHHKSPQQAPAWNANNGQSTLPSIPLIGMDDDIMPMTKPITTNNVNNSSASAAAAAAAAASRASNLDVPHQFNSYHSNKPSTSSPKLNAPSNNRHSNSHSHSRSHSNSGHHGANANANANANTNTNNTSHNLSSLQNSPYDKMQQQQQQQQSRQSSSSHHQTLVKDDLNEVSVMSSSDSSDSSDSDSNSNSNSNSSDSDSNSNSDDDDDDDDDDMNHRQQQQQPQQQHQQHHHHHHHHHNSNAIRKPNPVDNGSLPALLLDEDLRLSSNSSDSDDD